MATVAVLKSVNAPFNALKMTVKHYSFLHYRRAEIFIFHSKKSFSLRFFNCQQRRISPAGSLFLTSLIQTPLTVASIPKNILHPGYLSLTDNDISSFADLENFIKAIVCLRVDYRKAPLTTCPVSTVIHIRFIQTHTPEHLTESEKHQRVPCSLTHFLLCLSKCRR